MATNIGNRNVGFFERLNQWLNKRLDLGNQLPTKILKRATWICGLIVVYIFVQHSHESLIRKIDKAKTEMEEERAKYIDHKAKYMFTSKQSEIAKQLKERGLEPNIMPPNKIVVE
jgi:hypothetical protein